MRMRTGVRVPVAMTVAPSRMSVTRGPISEPAPVQPVERFDGFESELAQAVGLQWRRKVGAREEGGGRREEGGGRREEGGERREEKGERREERREKRREKR
eukprot:780444-Rhodomonas_salina.2